MTVDLTTIIVALLTLLIGGGGGGLVGLAYKERKAKLEKAKTAAAAAVPGSAAALSVAELAQNLAAKAVLAADERVESWQDDARDARADAAAARAESADARAMTELLSRQLAQATQHIRDLEPLLRAAGVDVPPWPPDPEPGHPVISHDRRHRDEPHDGPERRRTTPDREDPHG